MFESARIDFPKIIARIKLCGGAVTFDIKDGADFVMPTPEQRKNLKEMLCIEVEEVSENDNS